MQSDPGEQAETNREHPGSEVVQPGCGTRPTAERGAEHRGGADQRAERHDHRERLPSAVRRHERRRHGPCADEHHGHHAPGTELGAIGEQRRDQGDRHRHDRERERERCAC